MHEPRGLMALGEVARKEFDGKTVREVRLAPACRVSAEMTCLGLRESGRSPDRATAFVFPPGRPPFSPRGLPATSCAAGALLPVAASLPWRPRFCAAAMAANTSGSGWTGTSRKTAGRRISASIWRAICCLSRDATSAGGGE